MCDFKAASSNRLKIHKGRNHENIPHLDREGSPERDSDTWWDRNYSHCLKSYQFYIDGLSDIKVNPLSESEKVSECENVTGTGQQLYLLPSLKLKVLLQIDFLLYYFYKNIFL